MFTDQAITSPALSGFIHIREMSGKLKNFQGQGIVREFCDVSGKNEILQQRQGNVREFCTFFAKFIKFSAPVMLGKFELNS